MSTLSLRSVVSPSIKPTGVVRSDKPSKHASMWNALASRRAELGLNKVAVTVKKGSN